MISPDPILYSTTSLYVRYGTTLIFVKEPLEYNTTTTKTHVVEMKMFIYSTTTPSTTTREEPKRSANIREVENVVAAKLASIAVNCGGTQQNFDPSG